MDAGHDRYEELAVGHVLGGLGTDDAARFRSHLTGCRDCRARVAELRDIASDLAAAEREERARAQVKTEVARRERDAATVPSAWSVPPRTVAVLGTVAVLVVLVLTFWNFHVREQNAELVEVTEAREEVLAGLATGAQVPTELAGAVTGLVVTDATHVTVDLAGLPSLATDELLVVWLLGDEATDHYWRAHGPDDLPEGRLAFRDLHRGAGRLVVSVESRDERPEEPRGRTLVEADLAAAA